MQVELIEADPNWLYHTYTEAGNGIAQRHYSLSGPEQIAAMPVRKIAAKHSVLFMWVTFPLLYYPVSKHNPTPIPLFIAQSWGFRWSTLGFLWAKRNPDKDSFFMGNGAAGTRSNAELCLMFTRGNPKRLNAGIKQIISELSPDALCNAQMLITPIEQHSKKPAKFYDSVEKLFGGKKLRLYARDQRPGWISLGNELTGNDLATDLRQLAALSDCSSRYAPLVPYEERAEPIPFPELPLFKPLALTGS